MFCSIKPSVDGPEETGTGFRRILSGMRQISVIFADETDYGW